MSESIEPLTTSPWLGQRALGAGDPGANSPAVPDGKGLLLYGGNLRFVCSDRRRERMRWWVYGNDAWLKEGEEHTETLSLQLVPGGR